MVYHDVCGEASLSTMGDVPCSGETSGVNLGFTMMCWEASPRTVENVQYRVEASGA